MTTIKSDVIKLLENKVPRELLRLLLDEYQEIKTHFALGKYRPDELSGGRFAEVFLRILEAISDPNQQFTPIGVQINRTKVVNTVKNNGAVPDSLRMQVLPLLEVLLDVRNRRNVAHIGQEIDPNFSDSLLVSRIADWALTELIRIFNQCLVSEAQIIVDQINQIRIPIVGEYQGFVKVLDSKLTASDKTLVILYHKQPEPQNDIDLCNWINYKNTTRFKSNILGQLNKEAFIHYGTGGQCFITALGVQYVEKSISMELTV